MLTTVSLISPFPIVSRVNPYFFKTKFAVIFLLSSTITSMELDEPDASPDQPSKRYSPFGEAFKVIELPSL